MEHLTDEPVSMKVLQDKTGLSYYTIRYLIYKKLRPNGFVITYPKKGWAIKRHPAYKNHTVYDIAKVCGYKFHEESKTKGYVIENKIIDFLSKEKIYG